MKAIWLTPTKVNSRIIIDTYAWNRFNPNRQVSLSPLGSKMVIPVDNSNGSDDYYDDDEEDEFDDEYNRSAQRPGHDIAKNSNDIPTLTLTEEQLLLCSATLKGYSLKNKKWRK